MIRTAGTPRLAMRMFLIVGCVIALTVPSPERQALAPA